MSLGNDKEQQEHAVTLVSRKNLKITGVLQIISFDDASVALSTVCGELDIDGASLNIDALDLDRGCASVSGEVFGINYISERPKKKKRLWGAE